MQLQEPHARSLPRHGRGLLPPSAVLCSVIKVCSTAAGPWQGWAPNPRPGACGGLPTSRDELPSGSGGGGRQPRRPGREWGRRRQAVARTGNKALLLALGAARCCSSTCSNTPHPAAAAAGGGDPGRRRGPRVRAAAEPGAAAAAGLRSAPSQLIRQPGHVRAAPCWTCVCSGAPDAAVVFASGSACLETLHTALTAPAVLPPLCPLARQPGAAAGCVHPF